MSDFKTVPARLEAAADRRPDLGFTFVLDDGREEFYSFGKLRDRSREIATALAERGLRSGDRVALVLPTADEFIPTFFGVLHAGGVPVPLYPPMGMGQLGGYLDHCKHIVNASRAKLLITNAQIKAVLGTVREHAPDLRAMLTFGDLSGDARLYRDPNTKLEDLCFIQFTSGSTSRPKGVMVSHHNLAVNCAAIASQGLDLGEGDRGVSWLPLFHDMGLIGFVITPLTSCTPVSFMSPLTFLKRPSTWLNTISKHRGTITYAPNFAYALAVKRIKDDEIPGLDLSSLRAAGCGAEPIQPETLRAFANRYAKHGFKESSFVPSYGMAESTLAIAFSRGIPTDKVDSTALWETGRAQSASDATANPVEIVGCGKQFAGHEIKIVDKESGEDLPERAVGEIVIRGPSVTAGYFDDEEKTKETIRPDGWLKTGDLGYLANGDVFICGRKKDMIIINGKNYYPQDIEWVASKVDGVRAGNVIAFPTHKPGLDREAIVVVAESKQPEGREQIASTVKNEVQRAMALVVDEVLVVDVGTIPKTSSGKLQRARARVLYESGELKPREQEGKIGIAKRVLESQFAHLKLSIFGTAPKKD